MISNTQHSAPLLRRSWGRPALEGLALRRGAGAGAGTWQDARHACFDKMHHTALHGMRMRMGSPRVPVYAVLVQSRWQCKSLRAAAQRPSQT